MYFWETDDLSIKTLFVKSWDVFWYDSLGFKSLILVIGPDIIFRSFGVVYGPWVVPIVMFTFLLVPYLIHQFLIGNNNYFNMIPTFLKGFWRRYIFFSIDSLCVYGGLLIFIKANIKDIVEAYVTTTSVDIITSVSNCIAESFILVPFFFMAFSITIKNMEAFKALNYSIFLVKKHWKKVLITEAILVPTLLFPIFAPVLASYIGGVIAVYLLIVMIIQFCNLDYHENRPFLEVSIENANKVEGCDD